MKSKQWLEEKYLNKKLSVHQISKICHVSWTTVEDWLNQYSIPIRSKSEQMKISLKRNSKKKPKSWFEKYYIDKTYSISRLARMIGVSRPTATKWLKSYDIEIRSNAEQVSITNKRIGRWQGEDNPGKNPKTLKKALETRGDISGKNNPMYGKKHSEATKQKIRKKRLKDTTPLYNQIRNSQKATNWSKKVLKRDNYTCQKCNKKGGILEAHHIISFSELFKIFKIETFKQAMKLDSLWQLDNGITLCKGCHKETDNFGGKAINS